MLRSFGWSNSNKPTAMRDPVGCFAKHRARECRVIARRWDMLALQAENAEQRMLREQIANGWRELASGC